MTNLIARNQRDQAQSIVHKDVGHQDLYCSQGWYKLPRHKLPYLLLTGTVQNPALDCQWHFRSTAGYGTLETLPPLHSPALLRNLPDGTSACCG